VFAPPKFADRPAWLDQFFPPDPGALRLLAALRSTLAGALTFGFVVLLGLAVAVPIADRVLGFALGLFIAATLRDGSRRQQAITIALAPCAAFAATALAAILYREPIVAAAAAPPLMFLAACGAAHGPRYGSLGMVALISYMVGLVSRLPLQDLSLRALVLIGAAAIVALVRFVLLPERPQAELERLRKAIHVWVGRALARIEAGVAAGEWTQKTEADLRRDVRRLGDVVMLAQARVAALAARLPAKEKLGNRWMHLLRIELTIERAARVALIDLGGPDDRAWLLTALQDLRSAAPLPPGPPATQLAAALALLDRVLREPPEETTPIAAGPPPALALSLRPALQTAIAAALAVFVGVLISPNRWYWAAFAAFVMFQGTRSRSESIAKGAQFMAGTCAGVFTGMLIATLLDGHQALAMAAIIAATFLAFQANVAAYGVMAFWMTIILGLAFGMLGYFTPDLLLLRLKEAAVGSLCGALVASLVLVRRDRAAAQDATIAFLSALGRTLDDCAHALIEGALDPKLSALMLASEQSAHDLCAIAQAEFVGRLAARNEPLRQRVLLLEACEQWARELAQICLQSVRLADPEQMGAARHAIARIDATLARLTGRVSENAVQQRPGEAELADNFGLAFPDDPPFRAVRLLVRLDNALTHVALRWTDG
jgi:Fusaric acid resistance protein-like